MEYNEVKGLTLFIGIWTVMAFVVAGCMEAKLKRVDRVVRLVERDSRYVD